MTDDNNNLIANEDVPMNAAAPSVRVLAQYIKDLSFENPNSPASLQETEQPRIDLQLDVNARSMDAQVFEVDLKITAKSESEKQVLFLTELVYSGLFQFENVAQETIEPMLLIEAPRILFPFARQIIADVTRNGGFAPLMIDPMDFASMYFAQRQEGPSPANA